MTERDGECESECDGRDLRRMPEKGERGQRTVKPLRRLRFGIFATHPTMRWVAVPWPTCLQAPRSIGLATFSYVVSTRRYLSDRNEPRYLARGNSAAASPTASVVIATLSSCGGRYDQDQAM